MAVEEPNDDLKGAMRALANATVQGEFVRKRLVVRLSSTVHVTWCTVNGLSTCG